MYQVCRRARTNLTERVSFVQVEVTFHEDTGRAIDGSKDQAALVTRDWQRDTASERDTARVRGGRGLGDSPVLTGKLGMSWYLKVCLLAAPSASRPSPEPQITATFGRWCVC